MSVASLAYLFRIFQCISDLGVIPNALTEKARLGRMVVIRVVVPGRAVGRREDVVRLKVARATVLRESRADIFEDDVRATTQ